jgi:YD repeat-containing protein
LVFQRKWDLAEPAPPTNGRTSFHGKTKQAADSSSAARATRKRNPLVTVRPARWQFEILAGLYALGLARWPERVGGVLDFLAARDAERGWLTNKVYDDGKGTKYSYTAAGRLSTRLWARGTNTTYSYNNYGDLSGVSYNDGATPTLGYTYTRRGQQDKITRVSDS